MLMAVNPHVPLLDGEETVAETAVARITERGETRADDRISEAGMEDRKREGYF
jgi:sulfate adenylyltransferase subunit 2